MDIIFSKYQGTGNDFVMIDNRKKDMLLNQGQVEFLCDRRFGIGADGLIMLEKMEGYDFKMVYYNADGRQSSMCGNGGRCIAQFAMDLGIKKDILKFSAIDGDHLAKRVVNGISLQMINVDTVENKGDDMWLDTGSPHHIVFSDDVEELDIISKARKIRYNDFYKEQGVNVNFVKVLDDDRLQMRTYERGVEDETYSCGTGVTAAVLASAYKGEIKVNKVQVKTKGGELELDFQKVDTGYEQIWLSGPATFVYSGKISL